MACSDGSKKLRNKTMTTAIREKYQLYLFYLIIEMLTEEITDLIKLGISPIGIGYVKPLSKDVQWKIIPLLSEIEESVKETTLKMIEESVPSVSHKDTVTDWMQPIIEELIIRASALREIYGDTTENVIGLLHKIENILAEGN